MINHLLMAAALFGLTCAGPVKAAGECPGTKAKDPASALEYLRGDRAKLEPSCVVASIRFISAMKYLPSISVLVQYLDYADPIASAQRRGVIETYPALDGLVSLRRPVSQYLVAAIADPDTSELARQNAAIALQFSYAASPAEGIAVLVRAAHEEQDPVASNRLMDAARWSAQRCPESVRNDCEVATLK